jgi:hypothetical protein
MTLHFKTDRGRERRRKTTKERLKIKRKREVFRCSVVVKI